MPRYGAQPHNAFNFIAPTYPQLVYRYSPS